MVRSTIPSGHMTKWPSCTLTSTYPPEKSFCNCILRDHGLAPICVRGTPLWYNLSQRHQELHIGLPCSKPGTTCHSPVLFWSDNLIIAFCQIQRWDTLFVIVTAVLTCNSCFLVSSYFFVFSFPTSRSSASISAFSLAYLLYAAPLNRKQLFV